MSEATEELALQTAHLNSKLGVPGSGARRYAAAMYLYVRGQISPEVLEIYRRCCHDDLEDPVDLAKFEGLSVILLTH
ncbi:MAG: hypothetical protein P8L68_04070 [Paracoccaceae bacterium]|nr:hypothetical protein [Paracoccaceae bacterium]MDG1737669.1 hypothetical protein [Paracoccaceae bacterium]MDG2257652.1 hypothetical protein [Paracoccaceae bacterium]